MRTSVIALGVAFGTSLSSCQGGGDDVASKATGASPNARPRTITGRVVDEAGAPVAGLSLWVQSHELSNPPGLLLGSPPVAAAGPARTDRNGRFEFGIPLSTRACVISALEDGRESHRWGIIARHCDSDVGSLTLPPVRRLTGIMLSADGSPRPGVRLRVAIPASDHYTAAFAEIIPPGWMLHEEEDTLYTVATGGVLSGAPGSGIPQVVTDEDGEFALEGRFSRVVICWIGADEVPHYARFDPARDFEPWTVEAHPMQSAVAVFHGEANEPLAGGQALVPVAQCWPDHSVMKKIEEIPADGVVHFQNEGGEFWSTGARRDSDDPWIVRSRGDWEFSSHALNPESFPPETPLVMPGHDVFKLTAETEAGGLARFAHIDALPSALSRYLSSELTVHQGLSSEFQKVGPGRWVTRYLAPGNSGVVVAAEGFVPEFAKWAPWYDGDMRLNWDPEVTVTMHRAARPVVRVSSERTGEGLEGVLVRLGRRGELDWHLDDDCADHVILPDAVGLTDANGEWTPPPVCVRGGWFTAATPEDTEAEFWNGEDAVVEIRLDL